MNCILNNSKTGEEKNRTNDARFIKMLANIGDVIVIINQEGINTFKSPNLEKIFGWLPEDLVGKPALDVVHPQDRETAQKFLGDLHKEPNRSGTIECRYRTKTGEYRIIEFTGINLLHDPDISGILGNYRDITARKTAEKDYQTLFVEMLNGFALHEIICDEDNNPVDYRFLAVNPAFEKMTGLRSADIIGKTVLEVLPSTEVHWIKNYGKVAITGEPSSFEHFSAAVGKYFAVTAFSPKPGQFACIFMDVSERYRAEQERAQLQEQLFQAQKMESVGRLAGGVAHDFNNMLGVILGHCDIALRKLPQENDASNDLKSIQQAAKRSAELTRQLMTFARKDIIRPKVLNLNHQVEEMLNMLHRIIGEDISLEWKPAKQDCLIKMDPSQVDQVLVNMCVNARDAMPDVGNLIIETHCRSFDQSYCRKHPGFIAGDFVELTISDTGSGMGKEILDKIYDPFFTTKESDKGTGLGLATVYGIVTQNEGFIKVYSEPGHGTTFNMYFPRHSSTEEGEKLKAFDQAIQVGNENVLLVEDDASILDMTAAMLQSLGYKVFAVDNPDEALRLAKNHLGGFDLLITDVIMPEMNGSRLAKNIKSLCPGIKCLFMSGYSAEIIARQRVLEVDVNYIQKPFSLKEFAAKVREILDEGQAFKEIVL